MIFNWDILTIPEQELPPRKVTPKRVDFLKALLKPLAVLYASFLIYRTSTIKKLRYNSQVIILENLLNDKFDNALRRIRIITVFDIDEPVYLALNSENDPLWLPLASETDPVYLGLDAEGGYLYHFIVEAAVGSLTSQQIIQLKATVNYYRLAGKKPFYRYNDLTPF